MSIQRVWFHATRQSVLVLPRLLNPDGTVYNLIGAQSVSLETRRDNRSSREISVLGVVNAPGATAGTLAISDNNGLLSLTTDIAYFTPNILCYGVIWVDGQDFPEDGYIQFAPEGA